MRARRARAGEVADGGDAAVLDGDVGVEARRLGAVDDGAAADQQVVGGGRAHAGWPAASPAAGPSRVETRDCASGPRAAQEVGIDHATRCAAPALRHPGPDCQQPDGQQRNALRLRHRRRDRERVPVVEARGGQDAEVVDRDTAGGGRDDATPVPGVESVGPGTARDLYRVEGATHSAQLHRQRDRVPPGDVEREGRHPGVGQFADTEYVGDGQAAGGPVEGVAELIDLAQDEMGAGRRTQREHELGGGLRGAVGLHLGVEDGDDRHLAGHAGMGGTRKGEHFPEAGVCAARSAAPVVVRLSGGGGFGIALDEAVTGDRIRLALREPGIPLPSDPGRGARGTASALVRLAVRLGKHGLRPCAGERGPGVGGARRADQGGPEAGREQNVLEVHRELPIVELL